MGTDPKSFNYKDYDLGYDASKGSPYVDGGDARGNGGAVISFMHMPSGKELFFKAFINTFNETYASDWSGETVYGRADPIYMFKQTQRKIALGFMVPAASSGEAYENLAKAQQLVQFLYPMYTDVQSATTIAQSPLVRLKFVNLLQKTDSSVGPNTKNAVQTYSSYKSSNDASQGLLGVITNCTINHNLDNLDMGSIEKNSQGTLEALLPKGIEIIIDFAPIHEHTVGWIGKDGNAEPEFAAPNFPYGAQLAGAAAAAAGPTEGAAAATGGDADEDLPTGEGGETTEKEAAEAAKPEPPATQAAKDAAAAAVDAIDVSDLPENHTKGAGRAISAEPGGGRNRKVVKVYDV
jgi:hypothetical protein